MVAHRHGRSPRRERHHELGVSVATGFGTRLKQLPVSMHRSTIDPGHAAMSVKLVISLTKSSSIMPATHSRGYHLAKEF